MGNEKFTQAINRVENTCWPEIEDNYGYHNVEKAGQLAEQALAKATTWKDKLSGNDRIGSATADINNLIKTRGAWACGEILKGLTTAQTRGEFKVEPNTAIQTPKVAKTETAKAPTVNKPETVWLSDYAAGIGTKRAQQIENATK